ncbi:MAG: polymer-forming cytoskeletal protein [Anaerolineae bacterium]|nr:polymer-forming cytoskeletal protein [Anaerolineae bacterium]
MADKKKILIDPVSANIVNRVAEGTKVRGEYHSDGGLLLQGEIQGTPLIVSNGPLIVMAGATVSGEVVVHGDVYVFGSAGSARFPAGGLDMVVHGVLHVASTGETFGSISCKQLETYAGCRLNSAVATSS